MVEFREYYNHRRHHQGLPREMTPGQAWRAAAHRPSQGTPIAHTELIAKAVAYKEQAIADAAQSGEGLVFEDPQHTAAGRLRQVPDEIEIKPANPQIYLQGKIIKVPTHLVGTYVPVLSDCEYVLFDVTDGQESIGFHLPLEAQWFTGRMTQLWKLPGARIRNPKPGWLQKQRAWAAEHHPETGDDDGDGLSTK